MDIRSGKISGVDAISDHIAKRAVRHSQATRSDRFITLSELGGLARPSCQHSKPAIELNSELALRLKHCTAVTDDEIEALVSAQLQDSNATVAAPVIIRAIRRRFPKASDRVICEALVRSCARKW